MRQLLRFHGSDVAKVPTLNSSKTFPMAVIPSFANLRRAGPFTSLKRYAHGVREVGR